MNYVAWNAKGTQKPEKYHNLDKNIRNVLCHSYELISYGMVLMEAKLFWLKRLTVVQHKINLKLYADTQFLPHGHRLHFHHKDKLVNAGYINNIVKVILKHINTVCGLKSTFLNWIIKCWSGHRTLIQCCSRQNGDGSYVFIEIQHWWWLQEWEATTSSARHLWWEWSHYKARSYLWWTGSSRCPATRYSRNNPKY
jgi:hypothetical protein